MNVELLKGRDDEIVLPSDSACIISRFNSQMVEFNPFGTMLAIGCKFGNVLVMDFMTKEVVRAFNYFDHYNFDINTNVDQFQFFKKLSFAYLEDDFVHSRQLADLQEAQGEPTEATGKKYLSAQQFIKKQIEKQKDIQFDPKDKQKYNKAAIQSIAWSSDGKLLAASFKLENAFVVWNVYTCEIVANYKHALFPDLLMHQIHFSLCDPFKLSVSGDFAFFYDLKKKKEEFVAFQDQDEKALQEGKASKKKNLKFPT